MFTCLNNFFRELIKPNISQDSNNYYKTQYNVKLSEIETSFNDLKKSTETVVAQADSVATMLKRNAELFERRFATIADNIDNMIIIKTINRQWIAINDYTCKFLNIDRMVCLGKTNDQILRLYPQLNKIINILDNAEKLSWNEHQGKIVKLQLNDVNFNVTIKPIETTDKAIGELVLIGKKS